MESQRPQPMQEKAKPSGYGEAVKQNTFNLMNLFKKRKQEETEPMLELLRKKHQQKEDDFRRKVNIRRKKNKRALKHRTYQSMRRRGKKRENIK
jgi:hypothetical protein